MAFASRRLVVALAFGLAPSIVVVSACTDDEGGALFGPSYGDLPRRDARVVDGQLIGPDGEVLGPDGEVLPPPETCVVAILAGNDTSLSAAVQVEGGAWTAKAIAGGAAKSLPALAPTATGFVGVTHGTGDALQTTIYAGGTWTAAEGFGVAGVKGPPALAVAGTRAHVVYSAGAGPNRNFHHGIFDGQGWNAGTAEVGPPLSFGTVSGALAGVGSEVVFAENGGTDVQDAVNRPKVYARTFGTAWSASTTIDGNSMGSTIVATPQLVGLDGANDLALIYVQGATTETPEGTRRISFATRSSGAAHTWSGVAVTHPFATTSEAFTAARAADGSVLVAFRGGDGNAYHLRSSAGATLTWPAASALGATAPAVDSAPAIARGVCGDLAVAAYATGGTVSVTRLRGTSWSAPVVVPGLTGSRVAIATKE